MWPRVLPLLTALLLLATPNRANAALVTATSASVPPATSENARTAFLEGGSESRIGLLCHNDPVNKSDPTGLIDEGHMEPEGLDATVRGSHAILAYVGNQIAEMYREDPVGFIFLVATMGRAPEGKGIGMPRLSLTEKLPRLVTNPKHHFNSESPQPKNFQQLFDKSVADKSGTRWAKDKDGTIHRFSKPSNGESHWNGSTAGRDPIKEQNIPNEIKKKLGE